MISLKLKNGWKKLEASPFRKYEYMHPTNLISLSNDTHYQMYILIYKYCFKKTARILSETLENKYFYALLHYYSNVNTSTTIALQKNKKALFDFYLKKINFVIFCL